MALSDSRSPSYPQMSLARCVDFVRRIYEGAHRASVGNSEAQELMGYSTNSGSGLAALSALKRFGLVEGRDPQIRVTDLGLRILEPVDTNERVDSLEAAARTPPLFREMLDSFGGKIPADSVIRAKLIREKAFTSSGAEGFIRSFKETAAFVASERIGVTAASPPDELENSPYAPGYPSPPTSAATSSPPGRPNLEVLPGQEVLKLRLSPETSVTIAFDGAVSQENIKKLAKLLDLLSDSY